MKLSKKDLAQIDHNIAGDPRCVFVRTDIDRFSNESTIGFFAARDKRINKFDIHGNRRGARWVIKHIEVDCDGVKRSYVTTELYKKGRKMLTKLQDEEYYCKVYE